MKYLCFGYYDKGKFDGMTESEQNANSIRALNMTIIFAPVGTGQVEKRFRGRRPP